ncbi:MAG: hypothetical protein II580_05180 [Bacteroidales bacterium]|nr:hypothetical protein [Bacteroidales bacterium]MBQ4012694.1 hypothetical protein [Bacteroidales bacterium]
MKRLLSSISVLMVALFALVSCEQTSYLYEPTNECLTFSANSGAWLFTDEPVIEFQLVRGVLNSDLTVNLNLSGDGLFSLETPAAVHFAAGESTATVRVGYDAEQAEAGESYSFTVSFDKAMVSPAGWNEFNGTMTMPGGDDSEFVDYATVEFYQSKMNSSVNLYDERNSTLQVSKYDKTKYRIRNAMNSGVDLDFTLASDGVVHLLNETTLCPYDEEQYIKVPSTIEYEGELVTFWIDPNPKYNKVDANIGTGEYTMDMTPDGGTSITWYVWMETASKGILKFSDGDDGWWRMYYDVVNLSPRPNPDADYMKLGKVEFYQSKMNASVHSEKVLHSTLLVNKYDATRYRIKNAMNSDIDLDFTLASDGVVHLLNETTLCPYDEEQYIKIPSTIVYEGEPVTFWIDPNPKYNKVDANIGTGPYTMDMTPDGGTSITWYVWMETPSKGILTFGDGDDGWWRMYYDVTEVYY